MKAFKGLHLKDYQHDSDKAAFITLKKIKAFDKALDWVVENTVEKVTDVQQTGSSICVTQDATPALFNLVNDVARTVDVENVPQIYTRWGPQIQGQDDSGIRDDKVLGKYPSWMLRRMCFLHYLRPPGQVYHLPLQGKHIARGGKGGRNAWIQRLSQRPWRSVGKYVRYARTQP